MEYKGYLVRIDAFEADGGGWVGNYDARPMARGRSPLGLSGSTISGFSAKDSAFDAAFDLCKRRVDMALKAERSS